MRLEGAVTDHTGRAGSQGHGGVPAHGKAALHFQWPLNDPLSIPRDGLMWVYGS